MGRGCRDGCSCDGILGVYTHAHESTLTQREIKEGQKDSQGKMGNVTSEERGDCRAQQILKGN